MAKHHPIPERLRILARIDRDDEAPSFVARSEGVGESTIRRWRGELAKLPEYKSLLIEASPTPTKSYGLIYIGDKFDTASGMPGFLVLRSKWGEYYCLDANDFPFIHLYK